jgi:bifunctional DNase/RNase
MEEEMQKFEVKRVAGPFEGGAAIFLGNENKTFLVFVGLFEATAIVKEMQKQTTIRPLTHDLLYNVMIGFDIELKKIIISKIMDNTFCATLVLEQNIQGKTKAQKKEARIDARASDSIVLALKTGKEIWVAKEVYEKVEDVSAHLEAAEKQQIIAPDTPEPKKPTWEGAEIGNIDFEIPDYPPEDLPPEDEEKP